MKFIFLIFLLSQLAFSQNIKTVEAVKESLLGYWVVENEQDDEVSYYYASGKKLFHESIDFNKVINNEPSFNLHPSFVEVKKRGKWFVLKFINLYYSSKYRIKFLDNNHFIIKQKNELWRYKRLINNL